MAVSLTVAFEKLASNVILVELDEQVASVWKTIFSEYGMQLANRIVEFDMTEANINTLLSNPVNRTEDMAFVTIVKNRINRGGILAPGAGRVKNGEAGKGIKSRWYPATLKKRILNLIVMRERITFIHGDGMHIIQHNLNRSDVAFFIDPPYTVGGKRAGSRLYSHSEIDHQALFELANRIAGDFLITYNDAVEVRALAHKYGFDTRVVAMKNTHNAEMKELLIGRNLKWVK